MARTGIDTSTRGQLSKLNKLPPAADPAIAWAIEEARKDRLTQLEIMRGLNERLAAIGLPPVARSSLNRWITKGLRDGFPPRASASAVSTAPADAPAFPALRCPCCGADLVLTHTLTRAP